MTLEEISLMLTELFNSQAVQQVKSGTWQVETPQVRVLTDGGGLGEAISPTLYPSTPLRVSALDTWTSPK
ncbi:hypothetical protein [Coleofasciculus sp. F4-SAH-05]|uniref:hypothetical protein n=1 Tax=Coleofasciculus sp. F4-SAH-05 TaxID=3069525 RepID=UPI0032F3FD04